VLVVLIPPPSLNLVELTDEMRNEGFDTSDDDTTATVLHSNLGQDLQESFSDAVPLPRTLEVMRTIYRDKSPWLEEGDTLPSLEHFNVRVGEIDAYTEAAE
jgi:hypothetical protein